MNENDLRFLFGKHSTPDGMMHVENFLHFLRSVCKGEEVAEMRSRIAEVAVEGRITFEDFCSLLSAEPPKDLKGDEVIRSFKSIFSSKEDKIPLDDFLHFAATLSSEPKSFDKQNMLKRLGKTSSTSLTAKDIDEYLSSCKK